MKQPLNHQDVEIYQQEYIRKAKPLTVEKRRRQVATDTCTPKEISQLRGIVGTMQ